MLFIARLAFTFLAFLWSGLALVAQNDSIVIIPKIQKGEVLKLEMTKKKYKDTDDEARKRMYSLSEAELKCVDIKKTEIIWEFKINKVELKGLTEEEATQINQLTRQLLNSATQISFRISTDLEGTYTDLLNFSEIAKKINASNEKIIEFTSSSVPEDQKKTYRKSMIDLMKNTTATKEALTGMYMRELQLYLFVNGLRMEAKDTLAMETELPLPTGDIVITGNQMIFIKDKTSEKTVINSNMVIESDAMKEAVTQMMKTITKNIKGGKSKEIDFEDIKMDISRDYEFVWDHKQAKIINASITQNTSVSSEGKDAKSNGSFEQTTVRLVK